VVSRDARVREVYLGTKQTINAARHHA
jgi:hypothetical protein